MLQSLFFLIVFVFALSQGASSSAASPFNFLNLFGRNEAGGAAGAGDNTISNLVTSIRDSAFLNELTKPDGFLGSLISEAINRSAKQPKPITVNPAAKKLVKDLSAAALTGEPLPLREVSSEASSHVENSLAKKFLGNLDKLTALAQVDGGKKFIEMLNDPDIRNELFAHIFNNGSQPSVPLNREEGNSTCVCKC